MNPTATSRSASQNHRGVIVAPSQRTETGDSTHRLESPRIDAYLRQLAIDDIVTCRQLPSGVQIVPDADWAACHVRDFNTTEFCGTLGLDGTGNTDDLEREIILAMAVSPIAFSYPSEDEFLASVAIRRNIALAARETALDFDTRGAERPEDCWTYSEATSFTLIPGKALIPSLLKATQPRYGGKRYSFSCYRATEYVILLGIAQQLASCNPELLSRLQRQWEIAAIMSGRFHDVFLREYGSLEHPLPVRYYVPGDRLWFRNPDPYSSDASGYEGSWVIYLGNGLFSNFWDHTRPYTLNDKCLELYHWRNAAYRDSNGELMIDETEVADRIRKARADPAETAEILATMLRYREPQGVYRNGGCIDTSRECARLVCPGTSEIQLPLR